MSWHVFHHSTDPCPHRTLRALHWLLRWGLPDGRLWRRWLLWRTRREHARTPIFTPIASEPGMAGHEWVEPDGTLASIKVRWNASARAPSGIIRGEAERLTR